MLQAQTTPVHSSEIIQEGDIAGKYGTLHLIKETERYRSYVWDPAEGKTKSEKRKRKKHPLKSVYLYQLSRGNWFFWFNYRTRKGKTHREEYGPFLTLEDAIKGIKWIVEPKKNRKK